jgi:hypothetical protein
VHTARVAHHSRASEPWFRITDHIVIIASIWALRVQTNAQRSQGPQHERDFQTFPSRFQSRDPLACASYPLSYFLHAESLAFALCAHQ